MRVKYTVANGVRLSNDSRKNRLYKAFRELGRVVRTVFLLEYISD
ncbi:Tn3 family transposase, partial [Thermoactinomyces sp. CICC 10522]|nr:Tn3 family transposase [Thermoactinomyces sp. CICC 10522]